MTEYELNLAYKEGWDAYTANVNCMDCPYYGVSDKLAQQWENGWWDMFYAEIE